ncbi:MBL fold metallo-hydrolase [Archaeoglobus fulgidus]|uniref:Metallo-beta-lactamase domain-containing protein n=1 Tax=Archaeoglobus fulgidus (strain ATCC 49558 / DSM 4304 / JCM 9628 / NBRC 100126 / VC-16) TaxID=224325 RepID=O30287_ARCFU|nr:MBL fold metallo-hydrolase [Archaeoglobus fulgidus]AAB91282.1 conserved hypothetical protein [Archaeoglobus fulgidus DSM 4304]
MVEVHLTVDAETIDVLMKLKILYDNEALPGFKAGWGFSALLCPNDGAILFDTGGDAVRLDFNARKLGVNKSKIKACFISHRHADHTGGLEWLDDKTEVFFPGEYNQSFDEIETLYFTEPFEEQALIYKKIMLIGCSHPGIVRIARVAFERFGKLKLIAGGMHLFGTPEYRIESIAMELRKFTDKIAPCHCTGEKGKRIFQNVFGSRFIDAKAGTVIF